MQGNHHGTNAFGQFSHIVVHNHMYCPVEEKQCSCNVSGHGLEFLVIDELGQRIPHLSKRLHVPLPQAAASEHTAHGANKAVAPATPATSAIVTVVERVKSGHPAQEFEGVEGTGEETDNEEGDKRCVLQI